MCILCFVIDLYFEVYLFESYVNTHVCFTFFNSMHKNLIFISLDFYVRFTMYYLILQKVSFLFRSYKL